MTDTYALRTVRIIGGFAITAIVAVLVGVKMAGEAATLEAGRVYDVCLGMFGCNGLQTHEVAMVVTLLALLTPDDDEDEAKPGLPYLNSGAVVGYLVGVGGALLLATGGVLV